MLKPIVFWGASGHAKVLREFIGSLGFELVALFDNASETNPPFNDVPLHLGEAGFERWKKTGLRAETHCLVAVGGHRGLVRLELQQFLVRHGLKPAVAVHPTAFVAANAALGPGCQVLARAVVGVEVQIGPASIINTAASVDHECRLGSGVHIAPGATLAGCVEIGDAAFVGAGAVILPRIQVGRNAVIGAGAVVTRNVPSETVVYGNPARIIRQQSAKETVHAES